jgi:quercetin dioxygenase-like cupin family protein
VKGAIIHVYIDAIAAPAGSSTFAAALVHFTPGARTAWHTHPHSQTIFVTEGVGLCQRDGGPIEVIRASDRVFFEPSENHWHGAAPNRFMAHPMSPCSRPTSPVARSPGVGTSPTRSTGANRKLPLGSKPWEATRRMVFRFVSCDRSRVPAQSRVDRGGPAAEKL